MCNPIPSDSCYLLQTKHIYFMTGTGIWHVRGNMIRTAMCCIFYWIPTYCSQIREKKWLTGKCNIIISGSATQSLLIQSFIKTDAHFVQNKPGLIVFRITSHGLESYTCKQTRCYIRMQLSYLSFCSAALSLCLLFLNQLLTCVVVRPVASANSLFSLGEG